MLNSIFIYKNNGDLLVVGHNYSGQLGLGDNKYRDKPVLLMNDKNIKSICSGNNHSMIYKNNGDLFVFGSNSYGQLGLGDIKNRWIPTLLMNDKEIKSIHSGKSYSMIYKNNGDLLVFGNNIYGQLGLNTTNLINTEPILLMNDKEIKSICCGGWHSMIYKNNGNLFVFGNNSHGQLGLGDTENRNIPTLLMNNSQINMICAGETHSMIYKNNGDLFVFGENDFGQLGLGDYKHRLTPTLLLTNNNIKMICCGDHHSIIYSDGLIVFGCNNNGRLGLPFNKNLHLWNDDCDNTNKPTLVSLNVDCGDTIRMISCGTNNSIIYTHDGYLYVLENGSMLLATDPSIIKINDQSIL